MIITVGPKDANGYYTVTGTITEGGEVFTYNVQQVADRDAPDTIVQNLMDQHAAAMAARDPNAVPDSRVTELQAAADRLIT